MSSYDRDTLLTPMSLTAPVIVIIEDDGGGGNLIVVTLTSGTYYHHDDSTLHGLGYLGLWYALLDVLNNGSGANGTLSGTPANAYTAEVSTPTASTGYNNGTVTLRAAAATYPFLVRFSGSPTTTLDPRYLGQKDGTHATNVSSTTDGADEVIAFPNALKCRLVTHGLDPAGTATDKRRIPYKDVARSTSSVRDSVNVVWDEGHLREFTYEYVWGGLVYETRPDETEYASLAGLETGDQNAAWETVWYSLTEGDEVIVVHNSSDDLQVTTHSYEVGKLSSSDEWGAFARPNASGGDLHTISFALWVDQTIGGYSH